MDWVISIHSWSNGIRWEISQLGNINYNRAPIKLTPSGPLVGARLNGLSVYEFSIYDIITS
jgi:hypothetical protein